MQNNNKINGQKRRASNVIFIFFFSTILNQITIFIIHVMTKEQWNNESDNNTR